MTMEFRDLVVRSADGLSLYAREYGPRDSPELPVVCLPGLTRNSDDFHELGLALGSAPERPRRVISVDYRGRGRSDWDKDWRNYDVRIELADLIQVLGATGIDQAVFVGTSRGGLITMALSTVRPDLIAGIVLNDVGPVLEPKGLARIKSYVGKLPAPRDFDDAARLMRDVSGGQFPGYTDAQWRKLAAGTWREDAGQMVLRYDPMLMKAIENLDLSGPLPDLWPFFDALRAFPILAIRGENSDLLTADTLAKMAERHPALTSLTAPGEGHAPAIEGDVLSAIVAFITNVCTRFQSTKVEMVQLP